MYRFFTLPSAVCPLFPVIRPQNPRLWGLEDAASLPHFCEMMGNKLTSGITVILILLFNTPLRAQQTVANETRQAEFAIPVSPAFALLGADPALVSMPGVLRDFKVDWSFRTYRLNPNISVEAQPIWLLFYERADMSRYRKSPYLLRQLSTLNISFGTIQFDTSRALAWAVKMNLYRQKDPYLDSSYVTEGMQDMISQESALVQQMNDLKQNYDTAASVYQRVNIESQMLNLETQLVTHRAGMKTRLRELREMYLRSHWNSACVDVAFGRSYNYINESLDSLELSNRGYGAWVTGGFGIGRKVFVGGILRYIKLTEKRDLKQGGLSIRIGSNRFRFFVEGLFEEAGFKDVNAFNERVSVMQSGWTIAYGGDLKLGNNVALSFALRTVYDSGMNFVNLLPVANIGCLMR